MAMPAVAINMVKIVLSCIFLVVFGELFQIMLEKNCNVKQLQLSNEDVYTCQS